MTLQWLGLYTRAQLCRILPQGFFQGTKGTLVPLVLLSDGSEFGLQKQNSITDKLEVLVIGKDCVCPKTGSFAICFSIYLTTASGRLTPFKGGK